MPRTRECDFCGDDIEPGTGTMLVQNDGSTIMFCSSKCEKNADLGREARDVGWTEAGRTAGGKRAAETANEPVSEAEEEPEDDEEPEDEAATDADVVEDTGAAPDLEDAESEAAPGPEGEGAEEAAADADEDADDETEGDEAEEEEAEA